MAKETLDLEVKTNIKSVAKDQKDWNKELGKTKKEIEGVNEEGKEVVAEMQILGVSINGLKTAWSSAAKGAKFLFSSIKMGIASTGVGLFVLAFATLATWFTKTKAGAEALSVIFKGVGAAINVIVDRIAKFGGGVAKILSGNVRSGLKDMASSFKGIGTEIQTDTVLAMAFEKQLQNITDRERELNVEAAKRRADIEEYKLIAEDVTKTEKERLDAAEKAFDIENNLLTSRVENAENSLQLELSRLRLVLDPSAEQLDNLAQLEINLANIRGESTTKQIELNNKINAIQAETEAKRKEAHDKRMQRIEDEKQAELDRIETIRQKNQETSEASLNEAVNFEDARQSLQDSIDLAEITNAQEKADKLLDIQLRNEQDAISALEISDEDKFELRKLQTEREKQLREQNDQDDLKALKITEDAKAKIRDANINNIAAGIGLVKQLAGENKAILGAAIVAENVTGIAKTIIATQTANAGALATPQAIATSGAAAVPVIAANNIAAGISIASSVAATATALSQLGKGGGSGAKGNLPTGGGGGGTPAPQMMSGKFDLGSGEEIEPMRAYVVSDEITESQNSLEIIRRRATI